MNISGDEKNSSSKTVDTNTAKDRKNKKFLVITLILLVVIISVFPLVVMRGAEFGGSDDASTKVVEEINGGFEPWFSPLIEDYIGGEIPGEIESLLFCIQTGIGVGILAFCFGYLVARKKYSSKK